MSIQTSRAVSIRRCATADAEAMAALGARLFAETYGPTHPEPIGDDHIMAKPL